MAPAKANKPAAVDIPECPVCMERISAPIYLCQSGHSLCGVCTTVLCPPACPICRQPMTHMRNRALEDIVDKATMVPCPNRCVGCAYTLPSVDVLEHLKDCVFREVPCPLGTRECSWVGAVKHMLNHFKQKHPQQYIGDAGADIHEITFEGVSLQQCDRRMFLAPHNKLLFIVTVNIDTQQRLAYWTTQLIGTKQHACQYLYEIQVTSKKEPQRKATFIEHCLSDSMHTDDIFRQNNCAVMPLGMLGHFVKRNKLLFRYSIRKAGSNRNHVPDESVSSSAGLKGPRQKGSRQKGPGPRKNTTQS